MLWHEYEKKEVRTTGKLYPPSQNPGYATVLKPHLETSACFRCWAASLSLRVNA